ncbi:MAG TPA: hypothetical protein VNO26_08800 [Candidatus Limnocylindria bacterium]|nr:hypothetical protein [Candidatus Limnocylindria bacterium]
MLQLTASAAVAAQVVVCRAPSGHVELESTLDGDCCLARSAARDARVLRSDDACAGCIDTPLLRAAPTPPVKDVLVTPTLAPRHAVPAGVVARSGFRQPSDATPAPPGHRTVVLLI